MSISHFSLTCALAFGTVACESGAPARPVEVTVPRGATLSSVVDTLVQRGVVESPRGFSFYARLVGADRRIRAGDYALTSGQRWSDILRVLTEGPVVMVSVTIPEGFTIADMADRIAKTIGQPVDTIHNRLVDLDAHVPWSVPGPGLEGYLFPDTYRFARGVSLDVVVGAMVKKYKSTWTSERISQRENLGMTENEVVTLASIIQAEARRVDEMSTISAVYHNRLRLGYLLQADPTVLYALGGRRARLLFSAIDSVADSPYNTYTQGGLPPGPIGAPGEMALNAALYPSDEPYLYFVARPDGSHIFTRSLEEHNRARGTVRREWDQAGIPQ